MKRLIRATATEKIFDSEIIFTPEGVCELLSQIEELKNYDIQYVPLSDDVVEFIIGPIRYRVPVESPAYM